MKNNDNREWIKNTLEKSKKGVKKFTRISKLRIEIAGLKKKVDDKYTSLGKKAFQLIKNGEIEHKFLNDEYNAIFEFEKKIFDLENEIEELKKLKDDVEDDSYSGENYIKTDYSAESRSYNEEKQRKESNE